MKNTPLKWESRLPTEIEKQLFQLAQKAASHAYSPYSKAQVGAALWFGQRQFVSGCNIENASYGATVCAERVALWSFLKDHPKAKWLAICVYVQASKVWPPCGLCLQVLSEFVHLPGIVLLANPKGIKQRLTFQDLLPYGFVPSFVKPSKS